MSKASLRCAIYTRKSSEEGLEQGFNSLDAQREACEAFVLSQQHEGWKALPRLYDDGGYSGGNIERPALKQLLSDIEQKKVNVVVVYKVDRLTRSLTDFAKIVDQFDAKGISFVSVTQQFNTTSSMGRLTLNVLLSFAQFEREVTGERIRDKISASKQKGLWMGGTAPIGYVGQERTLEPVKEDATVVQYMYERYLVLGSIRALKEELDNKGISSPVRYRQSGKSYGGKPFSRGNLQRILTNPIYTGKMIHFEKIYEGQHPAIISQTLWDSVQAKIESNKQGYQQRSKVRSDSLLTGLLYDNAGQRLSPSHSQKQSKRYRYYISQALVNEKRSSSPQGLRLPAQEVETVVLNGICDWLEDSTVLLATIEPAPAEVEALLNKARDTVNKLREIIKQYHLIRKLVDHVVVSDEAIEIVIKKQCLMLQTSNEVKPESESEIIDDLISIKVNAQLKRCGYAMRLIVSGLNKKPVLRDENLIRNIAKAHQWLLLITSGKAESVKQIAANENVDPSYVTRVLNRAFLAPDIVRAILNGTQPVHLNLKFLKQFKSLPINWHEQRQLLDFK